MKLSQHGDFDPSLVERARDAMTYRFSEVDEYSFATCERPDGSRYGTSGQCRKGSEVSNEDAMKLRASLTKQIGDAAKEGDLKKTQNLMQALAAVEGQLKERGVDLYPSESPKPKSKRSLPEVSSGAAQMYIRSGQRQLEDAKAANDRAGMAAALRRIKSAQKQLAEAKKREAEEAAKKRPFPAPKQPSVKEVGTAEQRMVLKRLEERLDNAVTVNEQQRISNAIKELQARMG